MGTESETLARLLKKKKPAAPADTCTTQAIERPLDTSAFLAASSCSPPRSGDGSGVVGGMRFASCCYVGGLAGSENDNSA